MLDSCCAFTGHRPHKLPWRYNESDSRCSALKAALARQITQLVDAGVTDFYSGGADGVDCWASLIVLEQRKKNPALRLHMLSSPVIKCKKTPRKKCSFVAEVKGKR